MIHSTPRLILRKLTLADTPFILELVNDPAWLKYIGDKHIHNLEDARQYIIKGPINSYIQFGFGLYLVELKESQTPIGLCGLIKRETLDDVDIGFAFMPDFRGKGYGYEAASIVLDHAYETFGIKRILGLTSLDNYASMALLEKLGMHFDKIINLGDSKDESRLFVWERE